MSRVFSALLLSVVAFACFESPRLDVPEPAERGDGGSSDSGEAVAPEATPAARDAGPEPGLRVRGWDGSGWPLNGAPRRPLLEITLPRSYGGPPPPFFLFEGSPDEGLLDDLARPPLTLTHLSRQVIPDEVLELGQKTLLRIRSPLRSGATYTAAVGAWAIDARGYSLGETFSAPFVVATGRAGAVLTATWPAAGTAGVPVDLPLLALRFDDWIEPIAALAVRASNGDAIPVHARRASCPEIGWPAGECVVLEPRMALGEPGEARIVIREELHDRSGAPVGPLETSFLTATSEEAPAGAALVQIPCAIDEVAAGALCVLPREDGAAVRGRAMGPVRAFAEVEGQALSMVATRGDVHFEISGLSPETETIVRIRLVDLAGRVLEVGPGFTTHPPLAPLFITEVRADAGGPEPHQEYVEVLNAGETTLDLTGFALSDAREKVGDIIPSPAAIPPGAHALLVPDGFDPEHPDDPPVPPGATLIRVDSSLASAGLSNSGEEVFLRDDEGRRLSAAPAIPAPGSGWCIVRTSTDGRSGEANAFSAQAEGTCTPGRGEAPR